jgi:class 3 adenylate cyclase/tetratricopeptide (TPR) repeat protein
VDCPKCGHANPEGARFCGNCAASLAGDAPCPSCGASNPAGQRFCNACGHELTPALGNGAAAPATPEIPEQLAEKIRAGRALEGERKQVTVLFADVMGSMELAEQSDPEEWRRIMDRFFAILCEGVQRFEGTVDKFTGDGIMALFGAPIAHEDHAQRACYAVLHLQGSLAEYAAELRRERGLNFSVRIGLNSGEVVVGSIGEDLGMEYTAIGHTVGLAQRMEQLAEPGKAYLTEHTAGLVEGYLALNDLGEFQVKGSSGPLRVYELTGVGTARGRLDVSRARGFSRFVGREEEARVLDEALEQAFAGRSQVIGIVGEAGVGKSRLCDVFMRRCVARGIPVYHTSGHAHAQSIPLLPVLEILRAYFDVTDLDSAQTARERIAGKLLLLDESFGEDLPLIFDFLGVPDPERPSPSMDAEARQRRVLALTKHLVHVQSERDPGVTVFEDLHWLDPASEAFLANHVDATPGTRGLTLLNFRPEYQAPWMSKSYYRQIPLAPLGAEAIDAMLEDLLGDDPSLDGLPDLVRERTAGNPFFIEEIVQSLFEAGTLEGERGSFTLVRQVEADTMPASVQAVISARVDRLPGSHKAVLQAAAVIGQEFPTSMLARVAGIDQQELDEALQGLVTSEFVFEQELFPEPVYAFKHPLTREVAYRAQLGERRAALHAGVAQAIAEQDPERVDEFAGLAAHHWDSAGNALEAARWHARAGAWAGLKDPLSSVGHWRRVRELTDVLDGSPETIGLGLAARIFCLTVGWRLGIASEESETMFAEADKMASDSGDLWSHAILLSVYGGIKQSNEGDIRAYERLARDSIALAEQSGDPALALIIAPVTYAFFLTGNRPEAIRVLDRAIEMADGDPSVGAGIAIDCPLAYCYVFKGGSICDMGRLDEGIELIERGMKLAAAQGAVETVGWAHLWGAWHGYWTGDQDSASRHAQQSLEVAERNGDAFTRAWAWAWMGLVASVRGDWRQALDAIATAEEITTQRSVAHDSVPWQKIVSAEAHLGLGDADRAAALAREAISLSRSYGSVPSEVSGALTLARALMASDLAERQEIEAALARADELIEHAGLGAVAPHVLEARAVLAGIDGDDEQREAKLREAHRLFTEIGATGHAERLAGELAALPR